MISTLSQQALPSNLQKIIVDEFEKLSSNLDLVIFSDFNYGCLPKSLIDKILLLLVKIILLLPLTAKVPHKLVI